MPLRIHRGDEEIQRGVYVTVRNELVLVIGGLGIIKAGHFSHNDVVLMY